MDAKIPLLVVCSAVIAQGPRASAYEGDAKWPDETCSVTVLVQGMMKSRSGAT